MPTLIASYSVDSAGDNTNTLTTSSFTPSDGEVLVVKGTTWSTGELLNTPTGGSLAYTQDAIANFGGFSGYAAIWAVQIGTSPGAMTVSVTPSASSRHHIVVERYSNAKLAATPASGANWYNGTLGLPSVNITTTADNSIVTWCSVDVQSVDPATRAYLLSATEDGLFDGHVGSNTVMYFAYAAVGAAGAYAMGMSAPALQRWNLCGIEILDNSVLAKSLSESGAGADTLTISTTAALAESGLATEALSIAVNVPGRRGVMGWDLFSTLVQQSEYKSYYNTTLPVACPFDGTPLKNGPPNKPGVLYCPNGDFRYPEDWVEDTMSGM